MPNATNWTIKVKIAGDSSIHDVHYRGDLAGANKEAGGILCDGYSGFDVEGVSIEAGYNSLPVCDNDWVVITEIDNGCAPNEYMESSGYTEFTDAMLEAGQVLREGYGGLTVDSVFVGRKVKLQKIM